MFQFRLRTIFLVFVVVWCAMAACGAAGGIIVAATLVAVAMVLQGKRSGVVTAAEVPAPVRARRQSVPLAFLRRRFRAQPQCHLHNNLKCLALSLHEYHQQYGCFPPAYVADSSGKAAHSWRTLLLPYFDGAQLYRQYKFSEPWDGPNNSTVSVAKDPRLYSPLRGSYFCCTSDPSWWKTLAPDAASFFAVVGPKAAWRGGTPVQRSDLPEQGQRMILLVEAAGRGVSWKEPKDLSLEEVAVVVRRGPQPEDCGYHVADDYFHVRRPGTHVAFVNGSVHFLPTDIPADDLQALLTGDTSRPIDLDALARPRSTGRTSSR